MIENSAKAKLLFSYFLSNFDRIFNNKNPRWIRNNIYSITEFKEKYPNANDIISAAGFRFEQTNIHYILKDEKNYILAVLQYDFYNERMRYYINFEYTRQLIEAIRKTNIERPSTNTRAWFVFSYTKYQYNIYAEKSNDNSTVNIQIINNIYSMDDSYFHELLRSKTREDFHFGYSLSRNLSFSEFATILEVLLNIVRENNLL